MNNASQFLPFDGLRGWRELIEESEQEMEPRRTASEDRAAHIDAKLHTIRPHDTLRVTYYDGNRYRTIQGPLTCLDPVYGVLKIEGTVIRFEDIWEIDS